MKQPYGDYSPNPCSNLHVEMTIELQEAIGRTGRGTYPRPHSWEEALKFQAGSAWLQEPRQGSATKLKGPVLAPEFVELSAPPDVCCEVLDYTAQETLPC